MWSSTLLASSPEPCFVVVNCCGGVKKGEMYPNGAQGVPIPVHYVSGREDALLLALSLVDDEWSKDHAVGVHCKGTFHRGIIGLLALLKVVFDLTPLQIEATPI